MEEFEQVLSSSETTHDSVVYLGDFNVWMNDSMNEKSIEMQNILNIYDLKNWVGSSTHKSGNILDLVITRTDSTLIKDLEVEPINQWRMVCLIGCAVKN